MQDLVGEVIDNRYHLKEYLSEGSFGYVYRAEQPGLGMSPPTQLAVKILKDDLGEAREVLSEVLALETCDHANIVRFHGAGRHHVGKAAGRFFIAMELAEGTLESHLRPQGMAPDEVAELARQLCEGLRYLHARKTVHRDLKPANVLRVGEAWKLSDFGLAREAGYLRTQSRLGGTPAYSPPEGLGDTLDPSFDMWSLGCVLHQCLTGRLPATRAGHPPTVDPDLPSPLGGIVRGCLMLDPERRWSADMCLRQLDPAATPLHEEPVFNPSDCFLCEIGNDCARPALRGVLGGVRRAGDGYACTVYASSELEGTTLYLTGTWADLGARLLAAWPQLEQRSPMVDLSAFHVFAHQGGFRATDASLVVLDPDWLVKVTDLSYVQACERVLLGKRYKASRVSEPITMGNVVHALFPKVWNDSLAHGYEARREGEIRKQVRELARLSNPRVDDMRAKVDAHVGRLKRWADARKRTSMLSTESFVISPRMGLKGRIDALWFRDEEPVVLAELKTGSPRATDKLQLSAYGLMLVSRNEAQRDISSVLLYSKQDQVLERAPLDVDAFRQAVVMRNRVLLLDYTGSAPFREAACNDCWAEDRDTCCLLANLRGERDTRSPEGQERFGTLAQHLGEPERAFFQRHEGELLEELRAAKSQHAWLWSRSPDEREREGLAMRFTSVLELGQSGEQYLYALVAGKDANRSSFKVDESVLLSGSEGPTKGRLVSAHVTDTHADGLKVACDAPLLLEAGWVDAYTDEGLIEREFAALFQWMLRPRPVRDVVVHGRPPSFAEARSGWTAPATLNPQQRKAVELSVRTKDYLLVLGPPGAGKTTLLRAMIEAQIAQGNRVLVSAGTNRAVDQVVRKLVEGGLQDKVVRMGHRSALAPDVAQCGVDALYDPSAPVEKQVEAIRGACRNRPVVAATASFLARGDFDNLLGTFDLVIIDEATQLSVPATLGPLRFGRRFVLVGDPKQLPPIRMSRKAGQADSLFQLLEARVRESKAEGLVELEHQYRMNDAICRIPSDMWYKQALRPGSDGIARARLALDTSGFDHHIGAILAPERPVVFVDVRADFSHGPRVNLEEARWAARIVKALHASDTALRDATRADGRLGILAPFRAQVACIRRALEEHVPDARDSRRWVDTVDRFQGDERDLMIFSLVGGSGGSLPELLQEERRLNVALSRARHKLVLIGSHATLARSPLFQRLFAVMREAVPDYVVRPG